MNILELQPYCVKLLHKLLNLIHHQADFYYEELTISVKTPGLMRLIILAT